MVAKKVTIEIDLTYDSEENKDALIEAVRRQVDSHVMSGLFRPRQIDAYLLDSHIEIGEPEPLARPVVPHRFRPQYPETCPVRLTVVPDGWGTSTPGYTCRVTGGHCRPNEQCPKRVQSWNDSFRKHPPFQDTEDSHLDTPREWKIWMNLAKGLREDLVALCDFVDDENRHECTGRHWPRARAEKLFSLGLVERTVWYGKKTCFAPTPLGRRVALLEEVETALQRNQLNDLFWEPQSSAEQEMAEMLVGHGSVQRLEHPDFEAGVAYRFICSSHPQQKAKTKRTRNPRRVKETDR